MAESERLEKARNEFEIARQSYLASISSNDTVDTWRAKRDRFSKASKELVEASEEYFSKMKEGNPVGSQAEREISERGGALRWRTMHLPDGRYMHVAVTREEGPRGGRTVATEPKESNA